jgi:H+-translocating NAD(P) transhydrogenase subunit alpha
MAQAVASLCFFIAIVNQSIPVYAFQDVTTETPAEATAADAKTVESSPPLKFPVSIEKTNGQELPHAKSNRLRTLVFSLTIFALSVFVGFEVIAKVPPTLHTPLMSGSNAISGITIVGSLIAAGNRSGGLAAFLGMIAIVFAMINAAGGFMVTHRMLKMFKKR